MPQAELVDAVDALKRRSGRPYTRALQDDEVDEKRQVQALMKEVLARDNHR